MSRRVGLTANAPGLLKTVGNRPRKAREPIDDDAPPLSTDDEEDETFSEGTVQAADVSDRAASPKRRVAPSRFCPPPPPPPLDSDIDTSSDERTRRATIKPTTFATKRQQEANALKKRRRVSKSPEREWSQAKERLRPGSHLVNKFGFVGQSKAKSTYGKQPRSSQSSQPGSSQGSSRGSKPFRVPSPIESPQKKKGSKFIVPPKNILSSPCSSPKKLLTQLNGDSDSQDDDSILSSLKSKKPTRNGKKKIRASTPSPPRAVFKLPENFLDRSPGREPPAGDAHDLSKLSSDEGPPANEDDDRPRLKIPAAIPDSTPPPTTTPPAADPAAVARCPWCGDEVDRALLDDFSQGRRLDVRRQTRFCQLHKHAAALRVWQELGYPDITWDTLEARFAPHADHLQAVLDGTTTSPYRDAYAASRARTVLRQEDNFNPGYYGPRGLVVMCDYLVAEFGDALKKRAVDDRVIAGRGSAAFIQAVLVAELGMRLIMEDLKLEEEEARRVLEESKALGELVQPEIG